MKLLKTFSVGQNDTLDLYLGINDTGELKIGSKHEWRSLHMRSFQLVNSGWFNFRTYESSRSGNLQTVSVHLNYRNGNWWCNVGVDLPIDNNEFPYLFLSALDIKLIDRLSDEYQPVQEW